MQYHIYDSGFSGWVSDCRGNSVHFVMYNSTFPAKKKLLQLAWDSKPTLKMKECAYKSLKVFHANRLNQ